MTKIFEFREVGKLGKSRGIDGGIKFVGELESFALLLQLGTIFIKMKDGSPVPYDILNAEEKGDYILYLAGIDTPEKAKSLTGCPIMLERDIFEAEFAGQLEEDKAIHNYLSGFLLKDTTSGYQNRIERVEQYPQQEMLVMESGHLVPVNEVFIQYIDKDTKEIVMDLPHGLFEE